MTTFAFGKPFGFRGPKYSVDPVSEKLTEEWASDDNPVVPTEPFDVVLTRIY